MIQCSLHPQQFTDKPSKDLAAQISSTIAQYPFEGSLKVFANKLQQGCTWSALFSDEKRSKNNWVGQQLFGIDLDNCHKGTDHHWIIEHSDRMLGFEPAIIHESFSYTLEKPKYRIIYAKPELVTSLGWVEDLLKQFTQVFGGDRQTCEVARYFYGGRKGSVVFYNESSFIPATFAPQHKGSKKEKKPVNRKSLSLLKGAAYDRERKRRKTLMSLWESQLSNPLEKYSSGYECLFKVSLWLVDEAIWVSSEDAIKFICQILRKYSDKWEDSNHNSVDRVTEIYYNARNWHPINK